jgi:hypothetical protein
MIGEIGFARDSPPGAGGRMRRRGFPRIRRFDDAQLGEKAPFILTDSGDFDTKTQTRLARELSKPCYLRKNHGP